MGVFWVSLTLTHHEDLSAFRSILWSCLLILCRSSLSLCTYRPSSLQARISSSRQCCNSWTYDSESSEEDTRHCRCTVDTSCSLYGQCSQCECPIYDNPVRYSHCDCNILFFNPG